jgi:hypothetical protein
MPHLSSARVSATPTEHHVMPGARLPKSAAPMKSLYRGLDGHLLHAMYLGGSTMPVVFNWRSPTENDYLKHLDRPGFAWEFLRRNPGYQGEYETIVRGAASDAGSGGLTSEALAWRWGLAFPGRSKTSRGPSGRVLATGGATYHHPARASPEALF